MLELQGCLGRAGEDWEVVFLQKLEDFCLINLISFYSEITDNVGDEKVSGSCHSLP